jgi:hypothetical protein
MFNNKPKKIKKEAVTVLTKEHKDAFMKLVTEKKAMQLEKGYHAENVKALADELGWKTKDVNSRLSMLFKAEKDTAVTKQATDVIDFVESILKINN